MTDDHAYDAVSGSARFPGLQSPGFDRLRDEGTLFENAFVTTSLCSPSRATSLTDMYANCSGVPTNQSKQDPDEALPLIFEMLQDAGYNTAFIGKWHMKDTDVPRRGFDYWYSYEGQGTYNNPVMNENGTRSEVEGYTTDILIDKALWWIENNKGKGPFALFLWHKAPHGPFHPAPRHEHLYDDLAIPSPKNYDDDYVGKPAWYRRGLAYGKNNKQWRASEGKPIPDSTPPQSPWGTGGSKSEMDTIRTYLECQQAVDEGITKMLDSLYDEGLAKNTFILYTSDNGMNMFSHHFTQDKRTMWEESIRVPLIVWQPGTVPSGVQIGEMTLNVDYVPTFLDIAGTDAPSHLQGQSLTPLWRGEDVTWRDAFPYMYFQERWLPGFRTMIGLRDQRYKYIHFPTDDEEVDELFDLEVDPYELKNLYAEPEYADKVTAMQERLRQELHTIEFEQPLPEIGYTPASK